MDNCHDDDEGLDEESEYVEEEEDMECEVFEEDNTYQSNYQNSYYNYIVETDEEEDMISQNFPQGE
jgi:hypothetical protein